MITADTITDAQIRELKQWLFNQPATGDTAAGIIACYDGLGRSHRRAKARALCAEILNARRAT